MFIHNQIDSTSVLIFGVLGCALEQRSISSPSDIETLSKQNMKKQKKSRAKPRGPNHSKSSASPSNDKNEMTNSEDSCYKIERSETLGRYLSASKRINAGSIVMTDEPIVVGPCQEAKPLCIGCYVNINLKDTQTYLRCNNCGWPLCKSECPGYHQKFGHSTEECDSLSKSAIKHKEITDFEGFYYALTPFRCLLTRVNDPKKWEVIQTMESHTEKRKQVKKLWETNQKLAVNVIRNVWGFRDFMEDDIHFVCGVLEVNAFEVSIPKVGDQCLRAIYPKAFLFAHNCVPNTCHSNGKDFQIIFRAIRPIPVGEMITVSYSYTLQSTLKRRKHLQDTKFFSCCCKRCSDPTELNTYTGAMKCSSCANGFLLPKDPLDDDAVWTCNTPKCNHEVQVSRIIPILDRFFTELDSINGNDVTGYERFLEKCSSVFHDNHYLCLSALHCLSQLYGKINGYLINELTEEQLERKVEICRRLLKIFDKLEPGLSKQRGILLYELQAPLMVMLRRKFESQRLPKKEMSSRIKEVRKYLEEVYLILSKEPENSAEGEMARAAKLGLESLQGP